MMSGSQIPACFRRGGDKVNKYEVLEEKLNNVKKSIAKMKVSGEATRKYLVQYDKYVDELIAASREKKLSDSHGALMGLMRGLSDYDELRKNDDLWEAACEADDFYSKECDTF